MTSNDPGSGLAASCHAPAGRVVSLPVLAVAGGDRDLGEVARRARRGGRNAWRPGHGTIKHSSTGRWRAIVLALVHLVIIAHVIQWLITGMTLSPVEPSESMQTLRDGVVNAGAVMFVVAIGSTLVLGRFFCGWACHVVALQDACSWLMTRLRVKPRPFRSRLLVWFPLGLALYMFIWPVVHRTVIRPIFADERGRVPTWLGQSAPLPGITTDFMVPDFWATFPAWYVAIPFLAICGFACVYFLGSKGFCTYGCPYGGFFGPADLVAPGRIRVHEEKCHQCAHCTAACTSNVRVHEEVRDYGAVVDPGCMKCMDCVSVCPNDALYFGFGAPAVLTKPRSDRAKQSAAKARAMREARYDLSRGEEWVLAILVVVLTQCYRGMGNQVPLLMAVGMATIVGYCTWSCWRMLREPNRRLQSLQLKFKGSMRPAGYVLIAGTLAMLVVAAWSGLVRVERLRGDLAYARLTTPLPVVLGAGFAPGVRERATAERAIKHYERSGAFSAGGWGWALRPDDALNSAYARLVTGDLDGAAKDLEFIMQRGKPADALVFQIGQLKSIRGAKSAELEAFYARAIETHPELFGVRASLAKLRLDRGDRDGAKALWASVVPGIGEPTGAVPAAALVAGAQSMAQLGESLRATQLALATGEHRDVTPEQLLAAAGVLRQVNETTKAADLARRSAEASRTRSLGSGKVAAAQMLVELDRREDALERVRLGVTRAREVGPHIGQADTLFSAGVLLVRLGQGTEGWPLIREAARQMQGAGWDSVPIARFMISAGLQGQDKSLVREGAMLLRTALTSGGADMPMLLLEAAQAAYADQQREEALSYMKAAATIGASSAMLADRYASLLADAGNGAEAAKWKAEARQRAERLKPRASP
jgi:polyferredoxin